MSASLVTSAAYPWLGPDFEYARAARPSLHARLRSRPMVRMVLALALLHPSNVYAKDLFSKARVVTTERLEQMRGGFQAANGMEFSFGIERAVYVNGQLVAQTQLVLANMERLLAGDRAAIVRAFSGSQIVQNGAGNVVATAPAAAAAAAAGSFAPAAGALTGTSTPISSNGASGVNGVNGMPGQVIPNTTPNAAGGTFQPANGQQATQTQVTSPAVVQSTPAAPSAPQVATTTPAQPNLSPTTSFTVATGLGQTQTITIPNAGAMVTAVQNTVNNQIIETRTQIDATLNSLAAFRAATYSQALRGR